jgi:hypothetical protein
MTVADVSSDVIGHAGLGVFSSHEVVGAGTAGVPSKGVRVMVIDNLRPSRKGNID